MKRIDEQEPDWSPSWRAAPIKVRWSTDDEGRQRLDLGRRAPEPEGETDETTEGADDA